MKLFEIVGEEIDLAYDIQPTNRALAIIPLGVPGVAVHLSAKHDAREVTTPLIFPQVVIFSFDGGRSPQRMDTFDRVHEPDTTNGELKRRASFEWPHDRGCDKIPLRCRPL